MICVQCMQKLTLLEEAIGIQFKNICLLAKAFTHSSIEWNEVTKYVCTLCGEMMILWIFFHILGVSFQTLGIYSRFSGYIDVQIANPPGPSGPSGSNIYVCNACTSSSVLLMVKLWHVFVHSTEATIRDWSSLEMPYSSMS